MRRSPDFRYIRLAPAAGPIGLLGRIVGLVIGGAAFVAAVILGAVFLAALVGLVLFGWIIFMVRLWWLRRQLVKEAETHGDLEGQYTVIKEETITRVSEDDPHR